MDFYMCFLVSPVFLASSIPWDDVKQKASPRICRQHWQDS